MPLVVVVTLLSIALTTVMHFEALRMLNAGLPALRIPPRSKVLVAIFAALIAHALEIAVYGVVFFLLIKHGAVGALDSRTPLSLVDCLYFSAETYTSLGFGDVTPEGPIRLMAGAEALNGLLLIGWSASYAHIVMERFMAPDKVEPRS
jgi:Ion channel